MLLRANLRVYVSDEESMNNRFVPEDLDELEPFVVSDELIENVGNGPAKAPELDARRRLENLLEERRLRDELDDFLD